MKALILDRDGVINKEIKYLHKIKDLEVFDKIIPVLKKAKEKGYLILIITNQAGIAKGYYTEEDYYILTNYVDSFFLDKGIKIDKIYFCPHHPQGVVEKYRIKCRCRKPNTLMLERAMADFPELKLNNSILIGDKELDIEFGINGGIGRLVLVRSGHPIDEKNTRAMEIIDGLWELQI